MSDGAAARNSDMASASQPMAASADGTGSGTGTAAGIAADTYVQATTIPREIALQATFRF